MTTSIWTPGVPASTANADGSYKSQSFNVIADTPSPVLFTLTTFAYGPGTGSLMVFINGNKQSLSKSPTPDFNETSAGSFTINSALRNGDFVEAYALVGGSATQSAAASAAAAAISATAAQNYLIAIQALTPPSLPLSIANGGTGQITKAAAFNALSPLATKGDMVISTGATNTILSAGSDGMIPVANSLDAKGVTYRPAKPILYGGTTIPVTYTLVDGGKLEVVSPPTSAGLTVTIDISTALYPGWHIWIQNGQENGGGITLGSVTVQLSGSDTFRNINQSSLNIPIGGTVGIQLDSTGKFTVFTANGARSYVKVQDSKAVGTAGVATAVGLNTRIFNTTIANTFPGTDPLAVPPYIGLLAGTWQFRITTTHTGAGATRLGLYTSVGSALIIAGPNNPPNQLVNQFSGRIVIPGSLLFVQEYFSAVGTTGAAINNGNEVYAEAEFWRE